MKKDYELKLDKSYRFALLAIENERNLKKYKKKTMGKILIKEEKIIIK
ncbi:MAG: hypothetical protein ACMUEM_05045 [Flavobacteriales bacterium AspAUS03]